MDPSGAVFHTYHELHDWCYMLALVVLFAAPSAISALRRRAWRRRVLSAFR
jgi:hypothetical protein